ncbi:hypothetical protein ASC77_02775 [Nocardioides sp. Root1257]|uniref:hypothetical protein n=1 Tax=unclassified Nocardioides TaxID=2615069 RepID=UPI000700776D|nr:MULTISPECIES: hypothetical protein [unclassified Nocardioides]KQW53235.1 hypothetical protein ASC77_02775 [Nocardioides sp. Root1257]KRC55921.1 hypothetical protein ASE24_02775 [Nocardioides sp. Root224]
MKLGTPALALLTAALGATLVAGPVYADQARYPDPADATASLTDIRAVAVQHGPKRLTVKVRFTDLRARSTGGPSGLSIGIDTDATLRGPEFRLTTGLQSGTDYQLVAVEGGDVIGDPLTCAHKVRLDFAGDRLAFAATRACLGHPDSVRVAVLMRDEFDSSHPVTDWLGAPRSYTDWIASS